MPHDVPKYRSFLVFMLDNRFLDTQAFAAPSCLFYLLFVILGASVSKRDFRLYRTVCE